MSALEDFAVKLAQHAKVCRRTPAHEWEQVLKGLTETQAWHILNGFAGDGVKPEDFSRARARLYPKPKCEFCDGTGQVWVEDRDEWQQCVCPEGSVRLAGRGKVTNSRPRLSDYQRSVGLAALRSLGYVRDGTPAAEVAERLGVELDREAGAA